MSGPGSGAGGAVVFCGMLVAVLGHVDRSNEVSDLGFLAAGTFVAVTEIPEG